MGSLCFILVVENVDVLTEEVQQLAVEKYSLKRDLVFSVIIT